ncbi:chemotaxis protein CheC [Peribacillus sp. NPDC060186]
MCKIAGAMFGIPLEGVLLDSFSELGNMPAGNIATPLVADETIMDITPPTFFIGQTKYMALTKQSIYRLY